MIHKEIRYKVAVWMGAIATTLTLLTTPASANELTQVLADTPMQLQLKTLDSRWQRLSLSEEALGPTILFGLSDFIQSALRTNIYYTQGQTVVLGNQEYLAVYRPQGSGLTLEILRSGRGKSPEEFIKVLTPETKLVLSLINLSKIETIQDIQPFDLQQEIRESKQLLTKESKPMDKSQPSPKPNSPSPES